MIKFIDKNSCYIDKEVIIGDNCTIYPNVIIEGKVKIGSNTMIMHGSYIKDSTIGNNNVIKSSYIINSIIGNNNEIGPYANIHTNNKIGDDNRIGNFIELKDNIIGNGNKIAHLSYLGNSMLENDIHFGCGAITVNKKFKSDKNQREKVLIKSNAFIGCNVNLVAPLTVGNYGFVAAGSTITHDVKDNSLVIDRNKEIVIENYYND